MIDTEGLVKEIQQTLYQRKMGCRTVIDVQGYAEGSRDRAEQEAMQRAYDIAADIVEQVYSKAKEKAKPFGYVRYDGRTYQAELPVLKTEHKDGECSFAGFWEVKS